MASGKLKKDKDGNWEFEYDEPAGSGSESSDEEEHATATVTATPAQPANPGDDVTLNLVNKIWKMTQFGFRCFVSETSSVS